MNKDLNKEIRSTAHSKYRCKYHIVFAPKYIRKIFYNEYKVEIENIREF